MDEATEKGAGGENYRSSEKADTNARIDSKHRAVLNVEPRYLSLLQGEVVLVLQNPFHPEAILLLVGLGTGCAHSRTFSGIQDAELYPGGVDVFPHLTTQGVDLLHQVSLCQAADGGVAGHERNGIKIDGKQQRAAPHARAGQGSLAPRVPGPHYDDVVLLFVDYHCFSLNVVSVLTSFNNFAC